MATTNIELDIENITGVSDADDQYIKTAQKFVVSSIPKELLLWAGTSTTVGSHGGDSSPTAITLPQPTDSILDVQRNGFSAKQVPESMQGFIANSASLHFATETYPKYYIQAGNKVVVKPNPSDSETALVNYVDFLKIDDDCDLRSAVIFHAASQEFTKLASGKVTDWSDKTSPVSPTAPDFGNDLSISSVPPSIPSISTISYTDASNADASVTAVSTATALAPSIIDVSSNAPSYTKPSLVLSAAPSISNLSITAVPPSTPSIATVSYSDATNADASASTVGAVTVGSVDKADISGHAPAYNKPSLTSRVSFNTFFEDGSKNPFDDSDPGVFGKLAVPPTSPSAPTISSPGIATVAKPDSLGNAPSYTKPTVTSQTTFADYWTVADFGDSDPGSLSITSVTPSPPSAPSYSTPGISTITVAGFGTAPSYTVPAVASDGTIELTTIVQLDSENTIDDFDGNAVEVDQWWTTLAHLIEDEEDTELAGAQIQKINSYINAYSQAMQNQLNVFNDANVEYQAAIQEKLKNADLAYQESQNEANLLLQKENQEYMASLQKYQAEVSKYQAEVNDQVQEYGQNLSRYQLELNTVYTAWAKTESDNLQIFNSGIQNELNEFNKENAIYQANIQAEIAKHQTDVQEAQKEGDLTLQASIQDYSLELQKYSADVNKYQAEVNVYVQEYSQKLSRYTMEVDKVYTSWAKTESDSFQQYQLDITNELNEYKANNDIYQANIQAELAKHNTDLQKALTQSQLDSADKLREADLATDVAKFNKAQDQALALANAAKQMEDAIADNNSKIQKYSAELQSYQAQVTKEVQEYSQNLEGDLNVWQAERQTDLQKYASDIQNELNEFNKEQSRYQMEFQEAVDKNQSDLQVAVANANNLAQEYKQEAQQSTEMDKFNKSQDQALNLANASKQMEDLIADNQSKIAKYNSELQSYQAQVNKDVSDYTQSLQKNYQEYQSKLALYTADMQNYQSQVAEQQQKIGSATQNAAYYSGESKKYYEWSVAEINMYIQNNSKMINRTMAARAAAQR